MPIRVSFSHNPRWWFRDKNTGKTGVLLAVQEIILRTDTTADVRGSCGVAALDATSYFYHLILEEGRWIVKGEKLTGVS